MHCTANITCETPDSLIWSSIWASFSFYSQVISSSFTFWAGLSKFFSSTLAMLLLVVFTALVNDRTNWYVGEMDVCSFSASATTTSCLSVCLSVAFSLSLSLCLSLCLSLSVSLLIPDQRQDLYVMVTHFEKKSFYIKAWNTSTNTIVENQLQDFTKNCQSKSFEESEKHDCTLTTYKTPYKTDVHGVKKGPKLSLFETCFDAWYFWNIPKTSELFDVGEWHQ